MLTELRSGARCAGSDSGIGLLVVCTLALGCPSTHSGADGLDGDAADADGSIEPGDGFGDPSADGFVPYDAGVEVFFPPVQEVPGCGNGVLEAGEECDDRNRLNGDGCDWLCRVGDGDPPPPPDPSVSDYLPAGEPAPLPVEPETAQPTPWSAIPLVWTGSSYALTYIYDPDTEDPTIRFRRFDREAAPVGPTWSYSSCPAGSANCWEHDLVWTGDGFGLFYVTGDRGIVFQALEADGKPLGTPVVVESDPNVTSLAAARTPDGFLLAWVVRADASIPSGGTSCHPTHPGVPARLRRVGSRGEVSGPPVEIESFAQGPIDVAVGNRGVGLVVAVRRDPEAVGTHGNCSIRFAHLDEDLVHETYSGLLATGDAGQVLWTEDHYVVAFGGLHYSETDAWPADFCVARYDQEGNLERAPVCTPNPTLLPPHGMDRPRVAAGDRGLLLVTRWGPDDRVEPYSYFLQYLRTDAIGVAVGPVHDVTTDTAEAFRAYAVAWADDGFGVAWYREGSDGLSFRSFVAE